MTCCDYCGLPVNSSGAIESSHLYCCFGCRFAATVTEEAGEEGFARWQLMRLGLAIFFSMNVMVFTMALWTQDVYQNDSTLNDTSALALHGLFRYACLLFSVPVLIMLGGPLIEHAWENARRHIVTTDQLLVLGVAAATVYSVLSVIRGQGHVYFEVVCMVLVAVTLGRWLEATGKLKTTQALQSLDKLLPDKVRIALSDGKEETLALEQLVVGQLIRVLPGERIPVDGRIERNRAAIDQQIVTGESQPAVKHPGEDVFAGTLNLDGDLSIRVTQPPSSGTLQRLIDAVCEAATSKNQVQSLADQISSWFIPLVIALAVATFTFHGVTTNWELGLLSALSVLLIACPCALAVATPLAVWSALGRASSGQVVFRNGDALLHLAKVRAVCFDKTGTLTTGDAEVASFVSDEETSREELLMHALALASASTHALSRAICKIASGDHSPSYPIELETLPGRGIAGRVDGIASLVHLGSLRLMEECELRPSETLHQAIMNARRDGQAIACIGWKGRVHGVFTFRERLRVEAESVINELLKEGLTLSILTGDQTHRGASLEDLLGIDVKSEMLPEDKMAAIADLRSKAGLVAMVGDGINDAPALAAADVGIAMGCGGMYHVTLPTSVY